MFGVQFILQISLGQVLLGCKDVTAVNVCAELIENH